MTLKYRIVFMGTPDFASHALKILCEKGYTPVAVYTQPDKVNGRGKKITVSPVKALALEKGIAVYQPDTFKSDDVQKELGALRPDLLVVIAYGKILPQAVLDSATYGAINVHASLLPAYRGAAPIQRAIMDGCEKTGITIMKLDAGMDTGDILKQKEIGISPEMTAGDLFNQLSEKGAIALLDVLSDLPRYLEKAVSQDHDKATYAEKVTKDMGHIDWSLSSTVIDRLIRGMYPNPGTYTHFRGKRLKIHGCHVKPDKRVGEAPGTIISLAEGEIEVACGEGTIVLTEVQPENHKKMKVIDFIHGYQVKEMDRLEF